MKSALASTAAPTFLDRAIAKLAPRAAARRLAARLAFENLSRRAYDGAALGRRTEGWRAGGTSADAEIANAGAILRNRMRDLVRNNPHAAKAVAAWVNNIVGDGFTPYAATGDAGLNRRIDELWKRWSEQCDADGRGDFSALVTLAVREMVEAGECFVRRRMRRAEDGLVVPLQLQALEADHLDESRTDSVRREGGGRTVRGIEYDSIGRRAAYWLFPDHPGDISAALSASRASVRVPAGDVIHLFRRDRVQQRGVPWGAPVIRALRDLDDWTNAELVRKKTEACLVGIVTAADDAEQGIAPSVVDSAGKVVEQFEPGLIAYARGAKDIEFNQPAAVAGVSEWLRAQLHIIAAGWCIPYELLTGDLSQVNYSSIRAGLVEFRRLVGAIQWQLVIPVFCQPVWDWFIESAWAAGLIPEPAAAVEWQPDGFEAVDPQKDATADLMEIRMGTKTLRQAIAQRGWNPDALLEEIARTNADLDRLGIVLDSDPRKVTQQGLMQKPVDAADEEDANAKEPDVAAARARRRIARANGRSREAHG
jgi:lambda family phage portal protein